MQKAHEKGEIRHPSSRHKEGAKSFQGYAQNRMMKGSGSKEGDERPLFLWCSR